jgi:hypothetical protein
MYKFTHDIPKRDINFAKQTVQFKWQAASDSCSMVLPTFMEQMSHFPSIW